MKRMKQRQFAVRCCDLPIDGRIVAICDPRAVVSGALPAWCVGRSCRHANAEIGSARQARPFCNPAYGPGLDQPALGALLDHQHPYPCHHGRTPRYECPPSPRDRTLRTPVTRAAAASSSYSRSETPVITRISVGADSSCTSPGRPRRRSSSSRTAGTSPSLARFTRALAMAWMSASVTASRRRSKRAGGAWQSSISVPKYGRSLRFRAKHALGLGT